jgi:2-methylcitrate dehydratase PrpD
VLAALLAREGWTASDRALEGPQGYLQVFSAGRRELAALGTLGAPWKITTTGVAVKPFPSCACTHSIIDGALELRRTHALRPEQIAAVTIGVNRVVPRILIHSNPTSGLEAKFSGEFSAAAALVDGRVGIATFGDDKVRDPAVRALMSRVAMEVDPEIPGELERHMWTRVTVRLTDGRTLSIGPREVPGHPSNPLTPDALVEKFAECAAFVLPADRTAVVAGMLLRLDECPDLRSLTAILSP